MDSVEVVKGGRPDPYGGPGIRLGKVLCWEQPWVLGVGLLLVFLYLEALMITSVYPQLQHTCCCSVMSDFWDHMD